MLRRRRPRPARLRLERSIGLSRLIRPPGWASSAGRDGAISAIREAVAASSSEVSKGRSTHPLIHIRDREAN